MDYSIKKFMNILKQDKALEPIVFNEMNHCLDVRGKLPWNRARGTWRNTDYACLELYMEQKYGVYPFPKWKELLEGYCSAKRVYHPIKEYLEALKWDGKTRLEELLITYLGAEDSKYVRVVTRKTLVAAIARIYQPGIKFDHVLVLCGPQGSGKSSLWCKLSKGWYSDSLTLSDMKDKTAAEKLQGIWFTELSELAGLRQADVELVKAFLTRTDDLYRPPYAQYVESHPRSGIIVGTTNLTNGFLRDVTGNRRFWPVITAAYGQKSVWELNEEVIDQIWAEAFQLFRSGETLFLEKEVESLATNMQRELMEEDARQGMVEEYLNTKVPIAWDNMGIVERREYYDSLFSFGGESEGITRTKVCILEIWCECFKRERQDLKKADAYEIESILCHIGGWEVYRGSVSGKMRIPMYGVQRTFVRT